MKRKVGHVELCERRFHKFLDEAWVSMIGPSSQEVQCKHKWDKCRCQTGLLRNDARAVGWIQGSPLRVGAHHGHVMHPTATAGCNNVEDTQEHPQLQVLGSRPIATLGAHTREGTVEDRNASSQFAHKWPCIARDVARRCNRHPSGKAQIKGSPETLLDLAKQGLSLKNTWPPGGNLGGASFPLKKDSSTFLSSWLRKSMSQATNTGLSPKSLHTISQAELRAHRHPPYLLDGASHPSCGAPHMFAFKGERNPETPSGLFPGVEEAVKRVRDAHPLPAAGTVLKASGRARWLGMDSKWIQTNAPDGSVHVSIESPHVSVSWGFDMETDDVWEIDFNGLASALALDEKEVRLLMYWGQSGLWAHDAVNSRLKVEVVEAPEMPELWKFWHHPTPVHNETVILYANVLSFNVTASTTTATTILHKKTWQLKRLSVPSSGVLKHVRYENWFAASNQEDDVTEGGDRGRIIRFPREMQDADEGGMTNVFTTLKAQLISNPAHVPSRSLFKCPHIPLLPADSTFDESIPSEVRAYRSRSNHILVMVMMGATQVITSQFRRAESLQIGPLKFTGYDVYRRMVLELPVVSSLASDKSHFDIKSAKAIQTSSSGAAAASSSVNTAQAASPSFAGLTVAATSSSAAGEKQEWTDVTIQGRTPLARTNVLFDDGTETPLQMGGPAGRVLSEGLPSGNRGELGMIQVTEQKRLPRDTANAVYARLWGRRDEYNISREGKGLEEKKEGGEQEDGAVTPCRKGKRHTIKLYNRHILGWGQHRLIGSWIDEYEFDTFGLRSHFIEAMDIYVPERGGLDISMHMAGILCNDLLIQCHAVYDYPRNRVLFVKEK
eukprot:jgi/Bigna1/76535/fgenesh1_pg.42_\